MRRGPQPATKFREQFGGLLSALRDLMLGGRHNRHTLVRQFRISLPTADRWLQSFVTIPGVRTFKVSKTRWYEWAAAGTPGGAVAPPTLELVTDRAAGRNPLRRPRTIPHAPRPDVPGRYGSW